MMSEGLDAAGSPPTKRGSSYTATRCIPVCGERPGGGTRRIGGISAMRGAHAHTGLHKWRRVG